MSRPDQGHYQEKTMGVDSVPSPGYINQISLRVYWFPTLNNKLKYQPSGPQILTTHSMKQTHTSLH